MPRRLHDSPGKIRVILQAAREFPDHRAFVETGTAYGDLDLGVQGAFDRLVTIERDDGLYAAASQRLLPHPKIRVMHGDSALVLGPVLEKLAEPAVLWLDAHEVTVGGGSVLQDELNVLKGFDSHHVVLIDDARLCIGAKGWPTVTGVQGWAGRHGYTFRGVTDDIIWMVP